jgi:putative heme-binding domain-containing protein
MKPNWFATSLLAVCGWMLCAQDVETKLPDPAVAGNEDVAEFMKKFAPRGVMSDGSSLTPAQEAVTQFRMHAGLQIDLVASEPAVSQPLFLSWDSRGRMWVVQYRQYQFPAGLKVTKYDQHLRAVFDKVPEPPPLGVSGKDVISVFEDTDQDGVYDTHQDVITGLNIASSVQTGHGGVWVLNPPYLLFYPDTDGDDVPDGVPEVHLSGFGLQDTHSVANSLLWGPDGWLYGANGSTTIGTVSSAVTKGVGFEGQCIWRYHPDTREFEIYAEGGGNTFSLEIDSKGRVFSGTNGGGTRGFYYPQGSYSSKNWGKHGPLTNPYAFGFFHQMQCVGDDRRFPQAFMIYEGGLLPEEYDGNVIAPNAMVNLIWNSKRISDGSTYRTEDLENLTESPDRWFRPVYGGVGPDGSIYIADWYDTRLSHVSPFDDWHKESGRVYRIFPEGSPPRYALGDLHTCPAEALLESLAHPNKWVRQRAVLELGWRGEKQLLPQLESLVEASNSLEALWAINLLGELSTERAARWIKSDDEHIRRWVVRAMGDRHEGIAAFVELARNESSVQVRSQLAATAKRIPSPIGLAVVRELLSHSEDVNDAHMPLMIWWALEAHADAWPQVEALFSDAQVWQLPLVQQAIAGRIMQRYATSGSATELQHCERLVELAPNDEARESLLIGMLRAFQGRNIPALPSALAKELEEYQKSLGSSGLVIAIQQGSAEAVPAALKVVNNASENLGLRIEIAQALGEARQATARDTLLRLALSNPEPALQRVAMVALRNFDDDEIARSLVAQFGSNISGEHELRNTACRTLATRPSWAKALLREVTEWRLRPGDVPIDVVQQLRAYADPDIETLIETAFGKPIKLSSEEKLAEMQRLKTILASGTGDANSGKQVFVKACATCHKLFGEGNQIGPTLDAYDRGNVNFWLIAMVEPSAEIREGYQSYAALTDDGRVVTGMIASQDKNSVSIRSADNQLTTLQREEIETLRALPASLMPEDQIKGLTEQQIRDLFSYVSLGAKR